MTTELEDQLRAALGERGAAVSADRLRGADSPSAVAGHRTQSRWAHLAPILAAACVAVLAVTLALVLGGSSRPGQPGGARRPAFPDVSGRTWSLTTVQAPDGTSTEIAPTIGASVTFSVAGHSVEFQDGVAVFRAVYTPTPSGELRIHDVSGAPGAYLGHDQSQRAAIAGIDAIGVPIHAFAPPPIRVRLSSGRLEIITQGYRLSFDNPVAVAPSSASAVPTSAQTTMTSAAEASPARS